MNESEPPRPGRPPMEVPVFPGASQPSIIRAQQKDEVYLQQLTDQCLDAVRRLLGPRRALLWNREIRLMAELLYHALTTGSGLQTLGEEYCDILQATGAVGLEPGTLRRGTLVLLQSVGPFLMEKTLVSRQNDATAWHAARFGASGTRTSSSRLPNWLQQSWQDAKRIARNTLDSFYSTATAIAGPQGTELAQHAQHFFSEHSGAIIRLHLALFYLFGVYYQASKRLVGVRYLSLGRDFARHPRYRALGLLLILQLTAASGIWAARKYGNIAWLRQRTHTTRPAKRRHAALLRKDGTEVGEEEEAALNAAAERPLHASATDNSSLGIEDDDRGGGGAQKRCPLCLSQRRVPTATPCGHVFCWKCIAEWTIHKPECPLCRAEAPPSALVVVRHADF